MWRWRWPSPRPSSLLSLSCDGVANRASARGEINNDALRNGGASMTNPAGDAGLPDPHPLAILARVLRGLDPQRNGSREVTRLPASAEEADREMSTMSLKPRAQELRSYLLAAFGDRARSARGVGPGSLRAFIVAIHNEERDLYYVLVASLLLRVLAEPRLPLDERLARELLRDPLFSKWAKRSLQVKATQAAGR